MEHFDKSIEYGGSVELGHIWAESFMKRLGYSKRKGTKAASKLSTDFPTVNLQLQKEAASGKFRWT